MDLLLGLDLRPQVAQIFLSAFFFPDRDIRYSRPISQ